MNKIESKLYIPATGILLMCLDFLMCLKKDSKDIQY